MHTQTLEQSPVNRRGGQTSYLLLTEGQFGSKNLSITWVECEPGSMQAVHGHPNEEQVYVIVRGRGVMQIGDEMEEVGPGTLIYTPPGLAHAIKNTGDDPLTYVSATSPPFNPAELDPHFRHVTR